MLRINSSREDIPELLARIGLSNLCVKADSGPCTGVDDPLINSLRSILPNKPLASPERWEAIKEAAETSLSPFGKHIAKEVEAVLHGQAELLQRRELHRRSPASLLLLDSLPATQVQQ